MKLSQSQWETLFDLSKKSKSINTSYSLSYGVFLNFFAKKEILTKEDVIIGAHFAYGWMPTILNIYESNIDKQVSILNSLKNDRVTPDKKGLMLLQSTFNNSIVGVSKLMHFISPDLIPIWDSRVHKNLKRVIKLSSQVNTVKNFMEYLAFCKSVIADEKFEKLKDEVSKNGVSSMSDMRVIEQLLFLGEN